MLESCHNKKWIIFYPNAYKNRMIEMNDGMKWLEGLVIFPFPFLFLLFLAVHMILSFN